jgi:CubicO group peptidase (beta-lactamase class C family)
MGGVGTASALAKFYQVLLGSIPGPLSAEIRGAMMARLVDGEDKVLVKPTAFAVGCQLDPLDESGRKLRSLYGPALDGFGHPGAGGSHAFGDPDSGISFGYVMNQMELSVMPGERCMGLVQRPPILEMVVVNGGDELPPPSPWRLNLQIQTKAAH